MYTIGIGTVISNFNIYKFRDTLASHLEIFKEKDKKELTENYTLEYKDREFIFLDEDNNTEYTAQLIAIDCSNVGVVRPFVSYKDGEIKFEKAIKTIHEIQYNEDISKENHGNRFITDSECFIYGCNSSLMYKVIDTKYKDNPLVKNLGFSVETLNWLIGSGILDTNKLLLLNEDRLSDVDTLSKEGISELIGKIKELRKRE